MQLNRKVRPEILDSVALLVIDAQDSFIDSISDKEGFKKRAAFAIEAARCLKLHTLFTEQVPDKMGRTNNDLFKLAHNPRVFPKQTFSALGAAGIERFLREKEIYNLLVVGIETPICIYQTGLQATDEDIDITLLSDCLGARRPQDEAPVLDALKRMGCQVLPSETIFYSLLSDTQNPYFRAFTQIVKAFNAEDFNLETYLKNRPAEVDETPERPQKPQHKERPQRDRDDSEESDNRKERRPERRDDRRNDRKDDNRQDRRDDNHGEDSEERRNRKRGRRRGRGRGRDKQEGNSENSNDNRNDSRQDRGERPERDKRSDQKPQGEPSKETKPTPQAAAEPKAEEKPASKPVADAPAEKAPAKKTAKKVAKKAAKKATKKVAKKAAKKVAKKIAKKPEAE